MYRLVLHNSSAGLDPTPLQLPSVLHTRQYCTQHSSTGCRRTQQCTAPQRYIQSSVNSHTECQRTSETMVCCTHRKAAPYFSYYKLRVSCRVQQHRALQPDNRLTNTSHPLLTSGTTCTQLCGCVRGTRAGGNMEAKPNTHCKPLLRLHKLFVTAAMRAHKHTAHRLWACRHCTQPIRCKPTRQLGECSHPARRTRNKLSQACSVCCTRPPD